MIAFEKLARDLHRSRWDTSPAGDIRVSEVRRRLPDLDEEYSIVVVQRQNPGHVMRQEMRTLMIAVLLLAGLWLGSGCGGDELSVDCSHDSDCFGDSYCIDNQCAQACSQDDDCSTGLSCEAYQRTGEADPIQACLEDTDGNGSVECTSDPICRNTFNDPAAYCGLHGQCIQPGSGDADGDGDGDASGDGEADPDGDGYFEGPYQYIVIEQLNADGLPLGSDEDEEDDGEPEEDDGEPEEVDEEPREVLPLRVGAVLVRNAEGTAKGYGKLIRIDSDGDVYGALTETHIPLDEDKEWMCLVEPGEATYVSLGGPGGQIIVQLLSGDGEPLRVQDNWRVEIFADGPQCILGEEVEISEHHVFGEYRVFFCVSENVVSDRDQDCPVEIDGPLSGFSDLEVTFDP